MSKPEITMVCFDWGGVIVKICRSWQEACGHAGLPIRADSASDEVKARRRTLAEAFHVGGMESAQFFDRLSEATAGAYTPAEVERIHHAWLIEEYPGVDELVEAVTRLPSIETGLLSNTNQEHWRRFQADRCDGLTCFATVSKLRHRHASHLLRLAKPDVEIYHAFVRETGHRPEGILFFDDLEENIKAARAAGWNAEQIDHTGDPARQMRGHLAAYGVL